MVARGKVSPPRAVFDTNIVLSALLFSSGRLAPLREIWRRQCAVPLICKATAEELLRVLTYPKFGLAASEQEDLLADYLPYCETVVLPATLPLVPDCRDPRDTVFLHLAAAAKANWLVTGDADLLVLATDFPIPIVQAESFLCSMETASPTGKTVR